MKAKPVDLMNAKVIAVSDRGETMRIQWERNGELLEGEFCLHGWLKPPADTLLTDWRRRISQPPVQMVSGAKGRERKRP
ncbi:MAG: hypothetical protein U1E86_07660 [Burkholderiaceae bacterium]